MSFFKRVLAGTALAAALVAVPVASPSHSAKTPVKAAATQPNGSVWCATCWPS